MEEIWRENNIFYNVLCFVITENEKLFDRSDANLYWRTVLHIFGILHHMYIAVFATSLDLIGHPNPDIQCLYTYRAAYLTGWNFVFQTIFLGLSLAHDVLEWADRQDSALGQKLRYWKDVMFNGMVVPFTLFVTTMFWCVYAIDRELVFPKVYDEVVPWWFNHCVHTNITIMLVLETLLQARRHPTDERMEVTLYCAIAIAYAVVYYTIYYFTRRWLYQVFGVMTWWQVCIYQIVIWVGSYAFYKLHFPVNRLIHGSYEEEIREVKEEQKNGEVSRNGVETNGFNGENGGVKNGVLNGVDKNGVSNVCFDNGVEINGDFDKNGSIDKNGLKDVDNGVNDKVITDLKTPPFSTKSWSLKYRSIRSQFENSHL